MTSADTSPSPRSLEIDSSLVRRLLAAQFPHWADLPVQRVVLDGWDNRTFRLGDTLSVRLPSAARYVAQVPKEQHWLPRLAPHLPLPVPEPVALGQPGEGYPWHWSIYRWLQGEPAAAAAGEPDETLAVDLAAFLRSLQRIDPAGGPLPGPHNFFRGAPPAVYDGEVREAMSVLAGSIDTSAALTTWEEALDSPWQGPPVWLHGDVAATNLLVDEGRLCAVIDFGCAAVGDPACDLTAAWTVFSGRARESFRQACAADEGTWARARGWCLWKALITAARSPDAASPRAREALRVIAEVLVDRRLT